MRSRALIFLTAVAFPIVAGAQRLADLTVAPVRPHTEVTLAPAQLADTGSAVEPTLKKKNPALAGVFSYLLPGAGSFYAGSTQHGAIHLAAYVVSIGMVGTGLSSCMGDTKPCNTNVASQGLALAVVNGVWSIVTAGRDAHERNVLVDANKAATKPVAAPEDLRSKP